MRTYRITRTRGLIVSVCEACGETSGVGSGNEMSVLRWQRAHRCTPEKDTR